MNHYMPHGLVALDLLLIETDKQYKQIITSLDQDDNPPSM